MATEHRRREILLRLNEAEEMFQLPSTDLFSEYRNYLTGVELALSDLRGHFDRNPVELRVQLPGAKADPELAAVVTGSLRRYCDHRILYNANELRATRRDGVSALWIGVLIAAFGLLVSYQMSRLAQPEDGQQFVFDHLGWVLAWVGLWYPLDTIVFSTRPYRRENNDLARLRAATVVVEPWPDGRALDGVDR